jgi:distribution and morphology protein 10
MPPVRSWGWDAIVDPTQWTPPNIDDGDDFARKATLLHATMHLPPPSSLTALFLRRISPSTQLTLALASTQGPPLIKPAPQASLLAQLSYDTGKFSNEFLFSTDNALCGWRGLWNFGLDPTPGRKSAEKVSLLSAGAEAYYSPVSSLVGLSTGLKFTTLPAATSIPSTASSSGSSSSHSGGSPLSSFPYTLTLTLTPLTGSLSTTYSLKASPNLAFSSRFGFNVYSWESEMVAGCELWRKSRKSLPMHADGDDGLEWARRKMGMTTKPTITAAEQQEEESDSVVKIRVDQSWNVRLLWEGRVQSLLVTAGVSVGPGSFSALSPTPASPGFASSSTAAGGGAGTSVDVAGGRGGQSAGGGGAPPPSRSSYWRGVGVSVLYSS